MWHNYRDDGNRRITRRCSGPSRRVSFFWFMGPRCAGSATDRHSVMHMQPNVVDYASRRTPRRPMDLLRYAPLFAAVFAGLGLLQSKRLDLVMYDAHGRDRREGHTILGTVIIS